MAYEIRRLRYDGAVDADGHPHPDHPGTWVPALERLVSGLSEETRAAVLGGNVRRLYGVS